MKLLSTTLPLAAALAMLTACNGTSVRPSDVATNRLVSLQVQLGVGYMRKGKNEMALKRLNRALELDPDAAEAHNAIALLYERLNKAEEAERHYQHAVRVAPEFSSAHNNYGTFLCKAQRPDDGEAQFLEAVANPLYQSRDVAFTNAGLCMLGIGEYTKAETYFREALRVDPKSPVALLNMSELSYDQGRFLPARGYLQRYQEVGSHTPQSLLLGHRIESELGDKNAASSYAVKLRGNYPDSREAQMLDEFSVQ